MTLYFENFRYDVEKQLLYKNNELIPLKRNQAALLEFFLADADSIHSKEDILNAVWGDQIVSEQVVFQNISQLRSIFGSDAIKTFSGKGYKWQLIVANNPTSAPIETTPKPPIKSILLVFIGFVLIATITIFTAQKDDTTDFYVLSTAQEDRHLTGENLLEEALSESSLFKLSSSASDLSVNQAFSSPKLAFKKSNIPPDAWLTWGKVYSSERQSVFHYGLSNQLFFWQGYIEAEKPESLPNLVSERFNQLSAIGVFSSQERPLDLDRLRTMLSEAPGDPDLLLMAAQYHINTNQDDIALSYLQKLLRLDALNENSYYKAAAHWQIGKIYKMRGQSLQALNSLDAMFNILRNAPIGHLHFQYIKTKAWLAYSETDHETMFDTLENGLAFFEDSSSEQPLLMFKLHILYSILAQKASDHEKKFVHLSQAQALLLKHNLDESNLAIIYYHFALFSQYEEKSSPAINKLTSKQGSYAIYLEKILDLPRTKDNFWIHDEAMELLVFHHIEHKTFAAANALFIDKKMTPKRQFLRAEILLAQNQHSDAITLIKEAFEQAIIDYDTRTAIESALRLYHHSEDDPKARAEYLAYLETNANQSWLREQLVLVSNHGN